MDAPVEAAEAEAVDSDSTPARALSQMQTQMGTAEMAWAEV
jgi:hypothetical protein